MRYMGKISFALFVCAFVFGCRTTDIDMNMVKNSRIEGRVFKGSEFMPNIEVKLFVDESFYDSTRTGNDGSYQFTDLPVGTRYVIKIDQ